MTCITDLIFNLEALALYVLLYNDAQNNFIEIHANYIWVNIIQLVCSVTALLLSCLIKGKIRDDIEKQAAEGQTGGERKRSLQKTAPNYQHDDLSSISIAVGN